jgi:hypothetical protein
MKKIVWQLEYTITLFIIIGVTLVLLPVSIGGSHQARLISRWNEQYNRTDYMFTVIKASLDDETKLTFRNAVNYEEKNQLALELFRPYLRIDTTRKIPRFYRLRYMDGTKVLKGQEYYFDNFHNMEKNVIIGVKNMSIDNPQLPAYKLMFDMNGKLPPNTWGKDIFGVDVYQDATIRAFGEGLSMDALVNDCSPRGTGITCSYYYKIGGAFDDAK